VAERADLDERITGARSSALSVPRNFPFSSPLTLYLLAVDGGRGRSPSSDVAWPEANMTRRWLLAQRTILALLLVHAVAGATAAAGAPGSGQATALSPGKPGGVLNLMQFEDLATGFSIHETATIATIWPAAPCFSNLVKFDPSTRAETMDSIVPELAEKWSWQDGYRHLVMFLRPNVRWHDGQPFTSRDVKYTFDMVREAPDAQAKLRLNPRKDWYEQVDAIDAPSPTTVVFRLKRPQPSLLMLLASGQSPIYPAHVPPAEFRSHCTGTGPFKVKEWRRGELVEYVRNPDYFQKGRPYLDGLRYHVIVERGTRNAALQAGRLDVSFPSETIKPIADQLKAAVPQLSITPIVAGASPNLLLNGTRPPFNDVRVRRALSMAIDRHAFVQAVTQGGALVGAGMMPPPYGAWGLGGKDLASLPGYGSPAEEKARARKLLAEAGFTASNPLRVEITTRATASYLDFASFVVNELKRAGVETTLKQVDTVQWYAVLTRKEFQIGANVSGYGLDDPDALLYENYGCQSLRNYAGYCNAEVTKLMDAQSQELDRGKRRAIVGRILTKLEEDAARPTMGWRLDYFTQWPYVKNLVPHNGIYNWGRMQDVWLDR
jgi:peptide/nickel transport system substrate-binding protein